MQSPGDTRNEPPSPRGETTRHKLCLWCARRLPFDKRADAKYCKKACRQAAWRARIAGCSEERAARPLRLAYADPPYPGKSDLYKGEPSYAGEVDIGPLLSRLQEYDGWALSTSAAALPQVLAECVARRLTVRVAAWSRRPRPHKTARILSGWEPVVFAGGRPIIPPRYPSDTSTVDVRTQANDIAGADGQPLEKAPSAGPARPLQVSDTLLGVNSRRRPTLPGNCIGMKPPLFCEWIFKLLGALPGDTLDDLFPGSGIVTRSWKDYTRQASAGSTADP
jgi:hypothetical protein